MFNGVVNMPLLFTLTIFVKYLLCHGFVVILLDVLMHPSRLFYKSGLIAKSL